MSKSTDTIWHHATVTRARGVEGAEQLLHQNRHGSLQASGIHSPWEEPENRGTGTGPWGMLLEACVGLISIIGCRRSMA